MQFVADKDQAMPITRHLFEGDKEIINLLWCQHCGWLVENEQGGPAIERFDDLNPLPFPHRQSPYWGAGIDL